MNLMRKFIKSDLPEFIANDVRLKIIGDYHALAPDIVESIEVAPTAEDQIRDTVAQTRAEIKEIARNLTAEIKGTTSRLMIFKRHSARSGVLSDVCRVSRMTFEIFGNVW